MGGVHVYSMWKEVGEGVHMYIMCKEVGEGVHVYSMCKEVHMMQTMAQYYWY